MRPSPEVALPAKASGRVGEETVTYPRAFLGADIEYEVLASGLKETIVLSSYTGQNTFSFDLLAPGLTPRLKADGSIEFYSEENTAAVMVMPPPFMEDSPASPWAEPVRSDDVRYELRPQSGLSWRLDVIADEAWLTDSRRRYPVRIDPTINEMDTYVAGPDTMVASGTPGTNYGYSTELRIGYNTSGANWRTYIRPGTAWNDFIAELRDADYEITGADLKLYCFYRGHTGTTAQVPIDRVDGAWSEGGLTWNNQPALTWLNRFAAVKSQQWATWDVTDVVRDWYSGARTNRGFMIFYNSWNNSYGWSKFRSREYSDPTYTPRFVVRYSSKPQFVVTAPALDTAYAGPPVARWEYFDRDGKEQTQVQVRITRSLDQGVLLEKKSATGDPFIDIGSPSGGWEDGRYFFRARVAADDNGQEVWSRWSTYTPFVYRSQQVDSAEAQVRGLEAHRPTDDLGSGAAVDLVTGKLFVNRQDFTAPGLGGALGFGAVYESDRPTARSYDAGMGEKWQPAEAGLSFHRNRVPQADFHEGPLAGSGWHVSNPSITTWRDPATNTPAGVRFYTPPSSFVNGFISTAEGPADALLVYPGQRLVGRAEILTNSFVANTAASECGAIVKIHFYGRDGEYIGVTQSEDFIESNTASWRTLEVHADVPEGAWRAKLNIEYRRAYGEMYVKSAFLGDSAIRYTDSGGTEREFDQIGAGTYLRDPLVGTLGPARVNVALGSEVTGHSAASNVPGRSVDGVIDQVSRYDRVRWDASGGAWLEYELDKEQMLSEVALKFYDARESARRTYTYRIEASRDGDTWSQVVPDPAAGASVTSESWASHFFEPTKARYFRVIALGSSGNADFHVNELELPVTTLSDVAVATDGMRVSAVRDASGNMIRQIRDTSGRLDKVVDDAGRELRLRWSQGGSSVLEALDWLGIGSDGQAVLEEGVVEYVYAPGSVTVRVPGDGTGDGPEVRYEYTDGRLSAVRDGDGVGFELAYDGNGRVSQVTVSDGSTETVKTYSYATDACTVSVQSGGDTVSSQVAYDPQIGNRVTRSTADPEGFALETVYTYDEFAHVASVTDPKGGTDAFERDPHGNVLKHDEKGVRSSRAEYKNDRIYNAWDAKDNLSTYRYDAAWRPLSTSFAVTADESDGQLVTRDNYDAWGNLIATDEPLTTSENLLRNGAFETDPRTSGNGWDGGRLNTVQWFETSPSASYQGERALQIGYSDDEEDHYITSDFVKVKPTESYALSADVSGIGMLKVLEYKSTDEFVGEVVVTRLAGTPFEMESLTRVSTSYRPSSSAVAKIRVRLFNDQDTTTLRVDNVRFEQANAAGPFNLIENDSAERVVGDPLRMPVQWTRRSAALTDAIHDVPRTEAVSGERALRIVQSPGSGDGYFYSDWCAVRPGEEYTASAFVKLNESSNGARIRVMYYTAAKVFAGAELITPGIVTGSIDWRRYSRAITVPEDVRFVRIDLMHVGGAAAGGEALFDSVSLAPVHGRTEYVYDDATHTFRIKEVMAAGRVASSEFDARGRETRSWYAESDTAAPELLRERGFDEYGRLQSITVAPDSADSATVSFGYTPGGRLEAVTAPGDKTTRFDYDAFGNLYLTTSPGGTEIRRSFDGLGRLAFEYYPESGEETSTVLREYGYDTLGRSTAVYHYHSDGTLGATNLLAYDENSNVFQETVTGSRAGTIMREHDLLGRVTDVAISGSLVDATVTTELDVADLPTTVTWSALGRDGTVENEYAKTNQWLNTQGLGTTWAFTWNTTGALASVDSPLASHYRSHDERGALTQVRLSYASDYAGILTPSSYADFRIERDGNDRLSGIEMFHQYHVSAPSPGKKSWADAWEYDDLSRLTGWSLTEKASSTSVVHQEESYSYDAASNLGAVTGGELPRSFTYGEDNELLTAQIGDQSLTYEHDAFGRMTAARSAEETVSAYAWDVYGQLESVRTQETTATYTYGPHGMRERKSVVTPSGETTTTSFWHGDVLVSELDSDGTFYRYLYGPEGMPLELVVEREGVSAKRYAYQVGPGGHVVGLTTEDGTVAARYFYDPWGRVLSVTGAEPALANRQPLRYRAYYYDIETELYYLPERYYDPLLARFISQDSVEPDLLDPVAANLYLYCLADPVNLFDPSGEFAAWVKSVVSSAVNRARGYVRAAWRWGRRQARRAVGWVQRRWRDWSNRNKSKESGASGGGSRSAGGGSSSAGGAGSNSCHSGTIGGEGASLAAEQAALRRAAANDARAAGNAKAEAAFRETRLSRPDAAEWEMMIVGSAAEITGYAIATPLLAGAALVDAKNTQRTWGKYRQGDSNAIDVGLAGLGFVPWATPATLSMHINATVMQAVTPWDTGY